jgi:HK97 family phage prohead protease
MANEIERRGIEMVVELRSESDPTVSGYAALYNVETEIGGYFREQIAPGAFTSATNGTDDVRALFNHDPNYVLGRTKSGTLVLHSDKKGLKYDIDLNPDDPDAQRVRAKIKRGDVSGSSFGFRVIEETWQEPKSRTELALRTITKAELFDVSPVTYPAYPQTSVSARAKGEAARDAAAVLEARIDVAVRERQRLRLAVAQAWAS